MALLRRGLHLHRFLRRRNVPRPLHMYPCAKGLRSEITWPLPAKRSGRISHWYLQCYYRSVYFSITSPFCMGFANEAAGEIAVDGIIWTRGIVG